MNKMIAVLAIAALPVWANAAGNHGAVVATSAQATGVST